MFATMTTPGAPGTPDDRAETPTDPHSDPSIHPAADPPSNAGIDQGADPRSDSGTDQSLDPRSDPRTGARADSRAGSRLDTRIARAVFAATFALYLLTSGREPPWGDGNIQYRVAESLVHHGSLAIGRAWPEDLPPGRDGKFYSTYPLATSVVQIPGLLLFDAASAVRPELRGLARPLTSHLACAAFGALACALFYRLCRQRRLSPRASSAATVVLAVATTVWVYARYSYSEIAQTALFTGFVLELLRVLDEPTPRRARWLGLYAGLLFSMKYIYAASIVGGALYLALALRRDRRAPGVALAAATTAAPFAIIALVYNALCWGSPLSTGYAPYFASDWGENPLVGLWGMLLSPGKSLFLYSPPLVLGFAALPRLWRDHRAACLAVIAAGAPVLAIYSYYKRDGDYAWGPRFVVFLVPALGLGFAALLDAWLAQPPRRMRRAVLAVVVAAGIGVQLLGNAFYWDHFIRISMDARTAWLGSPNRIGAFVPVRADGHCDACFEDVHQLEWLPPFQPIRGHLWLLEATLAGEDARAAEAHAPWHEYTSLALDLSRSYPRVRIDWWGLLWIRDVPRSWLAGLVLLVAMTAGTAAGAIAWRRAHRQLPTTPVRRPPASPSRSAGAPTER
jgi:hypothetical protein